VLSDIEIAEPIYLVKQLGVRQLKEFLQNSHVESQRLRGSALEEQFYESRRNCKISTKCSGLIMIESVGKKHVHKLERAVVFIDEQSLRNHLRAREREH
jgi:hypothetical protein